MKLRIFLFTFIVSIAASIVFLIFYIKAIYSLSMAAYDGYEPDSTNFFSYIMTPEIIISFLLMVFAALAYRIMAIVWVARNKIISGGEKAIWIIGFIMLGFVTAIVFLLLAKSRQLVENQPPGDLQGNMA